MQSLTLTLILAVWSAAYSAPTVEHINPSYQEQPEVALCRDCVVAGQLTKKVTL
jgi:hypothetical protein